MNTQTVEYLHFDDPAFSSNGKFAVNAEVRNAVVEQSDAPPPGVARVKVDAIGWCGSDTPPGYVATRYSADLRDRKKADRNAQFLQGKGIANAGSLMDSVIGTFSSHEGLLTVQAVTPDTERTTLPIPGYFPVVEDGKIKGLEYRVEPYDLNQFKPGDRATSLASYRCLDHTFNINPQTGFPDPCHRREEEEDHKPKMVPGRAHELWGFGVETPEGLHIPTRMLVKVTDHVSDWLAKNPGGEALLVQNEPWSCWEEALQKELPNPDRVKEVIIIGDGPNSLGGVVYMQFAFPDAHFSVVGRNKQKLDAISTAAPGRVSAVQLDRSSKDLGVNEIRSLYKGETQADLIIPTIKVNGELDAFADVIKPDGGVIRWVASQTGNGHDHYFRIGDPDRGHASYGGIPGSEHTMMALFDAIAQNNPEVLDAALQYPWYVAQGLEEAIGPLSEYYTKGSFTTGTPDGSSRKIIVAPDPEAKWPSRFSSNGSSPRNGILYEG